MLLITNYDYRVACFVAILASTLLVLDMMGEIKMVEVKEDQSSKMLMFEMLMSLCRCRIEAREMSVASGVMLVRVFKAAG